MKLTQKQGNHIAGFFATFTINSILFGITSIFSDMPFTNALLFSFINAIWMTFIFLPLLSKILSYLKKNNKKTIPQDNKQNKPRIIS